MAARWPKEGRMAGQKTPVRRRTQRRSHKGRLKRRLLQLLVAAGTPLLIGLAGVFVWSLIASKNSGELVHFEVEDQETKRLVERLTEAGLVTSPTLMTLYLTTLAPGAEFAERSHLLRKGLSPRELAQRLAQVGSRSRARVTIPEGWTHLQVAKRLEKKGICSRLGFQAAMFNNALLRKLTIPASSAEGYLFPATYSLREDSDPEQVLKRFVEETVSRYHSLLLKLTMDRDVKTLNLDRHDVLILASMIEKETGKKTERDRVARVFLNRLLQPQAETRGRLQSDPTAAYGCQVDPLSAPSCSDYSKTVTPRMLLDSANLYNTYRHAGLPPGPISNPGVEAIRAVLNPAKGSELYFVADGRGGHQFSVSFAEHKKAIEVLRKHSLQ